MDINDKKYFFSLRKYYLKQGVALVDGLMVAPHALLVRLAVINALLGDDGLVEAEDLSNDIARLTVQGRQQNLYRMRIN